MNTQPNERHPNFRHSGVQHHHVSSIALGALLATLLASSASAQQEVGHMPFNARAHVHASSPNQAMETTTHASSNMAIPLRNKPTTVPKPQQPKQSPQAHPGRHYAEVSHAPSSTIKPVTHKPPHVYTAKQRSLHAPTGPGPMRTQTGGTSAANAHSIIFVGGHAQPLQPGVKQSLNPQPIPPGHAVRHFGPPVAPIKTHRPLSRSPSVDPTGTTS